MNKIKKLAIASLAFAPVISFADEGNAPLTVVNKIGSIVRAAGPIVFGLISVYFLYNIVRFLMVKDEKLRADARKAIGYSIIGIAIAVSIWGLVAVLSNFFEVTPSSTTTTPNFPGVEEI